MNGSLFFFLKELFIKIFYKGEQRQQMLTELQQTKLQLAAQERAELDALLNLFVDVQNLQYTQYEINELRRNKRFFAAVRSRVFEPGERGLTFISCEFDKSSKREYRGYLIVTNKRLYFLRFDLQFVEKFRYQTIHNVNWFADGLVERGLRIQYGTRRLEFDEIFDQEQLMRVGNLIMRLSSR